MRLNKNDWKLAGHIGVDAGLVWIGDPCYVLFKGENKQYKSLGNNWPEFCNRLNGDVTSFNYDHGHEGLGIAISSGYGDGSYPVYVRYDSEGYVAQIMVDFMGVLAEDED